MAFNVFLSHNSKDKPAVQKIAEALKGYGLTYWLDDSEIPPGKPFLDAIEAGLRGSKSVAVFVGPHSMGQWEKPEYRIAFSQSLAREIPVIPVFLPGVTEQIINDLSPALTTVQWVDFRKGLNDPDALFKLRWGITGKRPEEPKEAPTAARDAERPVRRDPVDNVIKDLVETLRSQNLTFFIGPGASYSNPPARTCDIARELLRDLQIIEDDCQWLFQIDIAGLYYSVDSSDQRLEGRIVKMLEDFPRDISGTQDSLARLLNMLATRPKRRIRGDPRQLIVTTNLDLMTERALLRAGLPFSRIVQHRSGDQISVNEYKDIKLAEDNVLEYPGQQGPQRLDLADPYALDDFIQRHGARPIRNKENLGSDDNALHTLPLHQLTEPILYKSLGSQELQNSCVLSIAHHYEFARNVMRRKCIPAQITEIIGNSTILFIGLSFMDPDFRLTYNTLLTSALDDINRSDRGYAIQLPPESYKDDIYRQMERGLWEKLKDYGLGRLGIKTIEEQSDTFLNRLFAAIEADITR